MHVFPGMKQKDKLKPHKFWHKHYNKDFVKLLNTYKDSISLLAAAHIHSHEFRNPSSYHYSDLHVPLMITPSVSPIFGNNPMYQTYELQFPQ